MSLLIKLLRENTLKEFRRAQDFLPRRWMGSPVQSMLPPWVINPTLMSPTRQAAPTSFIPTAAPGYSPSYATYGAPTGFTPPAPQPDFSGYGNLGRYPGGYGGPVSGGALPAPRNNPPGGSVVQPGPGAPAASMGGNSFAQKAPAIMHNLMRDFNLKDYQAAAIVGNLGHESGGFKHFQEIEPTVPGSRGGAGWAQWTGPRRRAFEAYAKQNNLDLRSDAANYGFLKHEISTQYGGALAGLKRTSNAEDAMTHWEGAYEGSSKKNYPSRMEYTNIALASHKNYQPPENSPQNTQNPQNTQTTQNTNVGSRFTTTGHDLTHVNPDLLQALKAGSEYLPAGYTVEMSSGYRDPEHNARVGGAAHSNHLSGNAIDVKIYDQNGEVIPNKNSGPGSAYGLMARGMYHELKSNNPQLADNFRWGGNINYHGFADSMHYDFHPNGDGGVLAKQYQQYAKTDNFQNPQYLAQLNQPRDQQNQQPSQVASNDNQPQPQQPVRVASNDPNQTFQSPSTGTGWTRTQSDAKPLAIGDSLAVGVGGIYGNTSYAQGGWNPQRVSQLVDKAVADGAVKGRPVVLSGGASNAGGDSQMVAQYYPQMIKKLQDGGASHISVMGVGPYSHYDTYGYNKIIDGAASKSGVHFTGPLANIAPFSGNDYHGGIHPNDYRPIASSVNQAIKAPAPTTPPSQAPVQTAANTPPPQSQAPQTPQSQPPAEPSTLGKLASFVNDTATPKVASADATPPSGPSSGSSSGSSSRPSGGSSSGSSSRAPVTDPEAVMTSSAIPYLKSSHRTISETRQRVAIGLLRPNK